MNSSPHHWCTTYTGGRFWPLDPKPEHVQLPDIAHALSNICRFGGHTRSFYSVAQHSVLVSQQVAPEHRLTALLHDATEAYVGDIVRPLKVQMPDYGDIEYCVWLAVCQKFNLSPEIHPSVKEADNVLLMTERRDLTNPSGHAWGWGLEDIKPLPHKIVPVGPDTAETMFLEQYEILTYGK